MMRMFIRVLLLSVVAACSPPPPSLLDVPAPDLSQAASSVRRQVGDQYGALIARATDANRPAQERADAYGQIGRLLMAVKLNDRAEPALENAHRLGPSDARWPYYLGHLKRQTGDLAGALASFEEANRLQPNDVATLVWMGRVHLAAGRAAEASPFFTAALTLAGTSPPARASAYGGLGMAAAAAGDQAAAIRHFQAALAAEPAASQMHYRLAMAYRAVGDTTNADAHFARRGDLDADPPDPRMDELRLLVETPLLSQQRGLLAIQYGAIKEAARHFRRGLELDPEASLRDSLTFNFGRALLQLGDIDAAEVRFDAGLRDSPTHAPFHFGRGTVAVARGRHADAIASFVTALRHDPTFIEARFSLAEELRTTGRVQQSLPHYARVVEAEPKNADLRLAYVEALMAAGRTAQAQDEIRRGIEQHPGDFRFITLLKP